MYFFELQKDRSPQRSPFHTNHQGIIEIRAHKWREGIWCIEKHAECPRDDIVYTVQKRMEYKQRTEACTSLKKKKEGREKKSDQRSGQEEKKRLSKHSF